MAGLRLNIVKRAQPRVWWVGNVDPGPWKNSKSPSGSEGESERVCCNWRRGKKQVELWNKDERGDSEREREREEVRKKKEMAWMRGEPLVAKMAWLAKYVVLPGAMIAALTYSPPDYASSKDDPKSNK